MGLVQGWGRWEPVQHLEPLQLSQGSCPCQCQSQQSETLSTEVLLLVKLFGDEVGHPPASVALRISLWSSHSDSMAAWQDTDQGAPHG